jgi:MFS family permease
MPYHALWSHSPNHQRELPDVCRRPVFPRFRCSNCALGQSVAHHRATFTTIYNTTWYFGSIIAAWLTFGTNHINSNWQWRAPTIVQAFPSLLQLTFVWFVPESPRWYLAKGRDERALKVLADVHANGNQDDELVQLELTEIRDTIRMEQEFESNGWMELIRTKGNRRRLLILITAGFFSQWSGNGLVSYYIHKVLNDIGYTSVVTQDLINGVLQIFNFGVALTMCFFVDTIGRRKLFLTSTAGMLVAFIAWTVCSSRYAMDGSSSAAKAVIGMIFIYYFFYNLAWSGLLIGYTAEILPYKIRAKGLTVMFLCVDLARKPPFPTLWLPKAPKLTSSPQSLLQPIHQPYRS